MKKTNLIVSNICYSLVRPILWLFVVICIRPKIIHKENIPKGGFIYAGTHTSYFDAFFIGKSTIRPIHFLAKKELMDKKGLGVILKLLGFIRIDRSKKNPEAKEVAVDYLKNEKIVCLFPEGTINKTDDYILPFKYGAVSFAYKSKKPIVPFAIVGKAKIFRHNVKFLVGKPYYVKSDDYEKETKIIENMVINLIKEGRNYDKAKKKGTS